MITNDNYKGTGTAVVNESSHLIDSHLRFMNGRFYVRDVTTGEGIDVTDEVRKALVERGE